MKLTDCDTSSPSASYGGVFVVSARVLSAGAADCPARVHWVNGQLSADAVGHVPVVRRFVQRALVCRTQVRLDVEDDPSYGSGERERRPVRVVTVDAAARCPGRCPCPRSRRTGAGRCGSSGPRRFPVRWRTAAHPRRWRVRALRLEMMALFADIGIGVPVIMDRQHRYRVQVSWTALVCAVARGGRQRGRNGLPV